MLLPPPPPSLPLSPPQENPRNRLSKFEYFPGDPAGTRESEEVLITTIPKASGIHAAGWVDFSPADFDEVSSMRTRDGVCSFV